jgi:hypothetical protein
MCVASSTYVATQVLLGEDCDELHEQQSQMFARMPAVSAGGTAEHAQNDTLDLACYYAQRATVAKCRQHCMACHA